MTRLSQEREDYFNDLNEMFASAGYQRWMEEAAEQFEEIQNLIVFGNATDEGLRELRGRATVLKYMLDFPLTTQAVYANEVDEADILADEENEDNAEATV